VTPEAYAQSIRALEKANRVRLDGAAIKRELRAGRLTFEQALGRPEAARLTAWHLVRAVPKVGRVKAGKALAVARIPSSKRVGALTDRQREALRQALGRWSAGASPDPEREA
jgi:hypothetical protein